MNHSHEPSSATSWQHWIHTAVLTERGNTNTDITTDTHHHHRHHHGHTRLCAYFQKVSSPPCLISLKSATELHNSTSVQSGRPKLRACREAHAEIELLKADGRFEQGLSPPRFASSMVSRHLWGGRSTHQWPPVGDSKGYYQYTITTTPYETCVWVMVSTTEKGSKVRTEKDLLKYK